jgi:hypothetical protein
MAKPAKQPATFVAQGVTAAGRSKTYKRRGVWGRCYCDCSYYVCQAWAAGLAISFCVHGPDAVCPLLHMLML